jgi:hypothetical protein
MSARKAKAKLMTENSGMTSISGITGGRVKQMTETIDITPRGLQTPDGIRRVNAAREAVENANAVLANAATTFFHDHRVTLLEIARGSSIAEDDRMALRDDLHMLDAAIGMRTRTQEALLYAVAGQTQP